MRGEQDYAVGVGAGTFADDVAYIVPVNFQAGGFEKLAQVFAPCGFAEFRRRNFREANLLSGNPIRIALDPIESLRAAGILREPAQSNRPLRGLRA